MKHKPSYAKCLAKIEAEAAKKRSLDYGKKVDGYTGDALVTAEQIAAAGDKVSDQLKADIEFARERVVRFC